MSSPVIAAKACHYFNYHLDLMDEYGLFQIGDWSLLHRDYTLEDDFGIVRSRTLHCAPDFCGRERFFYVETNYGDVVDIRWDNAPDRFLKLFN